MKIRNMIKRYYMQTGAVVGTALVSTGAYAQDAGGGIDISPATSLLEGVRSNLITLGGLGLGAIAVVAVYGYLKLGASK